MIIHCSRINDIHSQLSNALHHQEEKDRTVAEFFTDLTKLMETWQEKETAPLQVTPRTYKPLVSRVSRVSRVLIWLYVHVQALLFGMCMK